MATQRTTEYHRGSQRYFYFTLCNSVLLCAALCTFLYNPVSFSQSFPHIDTIKLGLLIQNKNSKAALLGAEMAVTEANLKKTGKYFTLAVRDMEGPWGTGAKAAVDLIFRENVWAIIGSVDGRNSHLAEQASAKTRIPFLSAWSGDPSLAYAFIPWFFSCVPNDWQKGSSIIDYLSLAGKKRPTVIIAAKDYDSNSGARGFIKTASEKGVSKPVVFRFDNGSNFDSISDAIERMQANIVFYGPVSYCAEFKKHIRNPEQLIFCVSCSDGETTPGIEGVAFISPGYLFTSEGKIFTDEYERAFSRKPGDMSAYSYDITNILINACMNANEPDSLKNIIKKIKYQGVTGSVRFDERGNRAGKAGLMIVKDGKFEKIY